MRLALLAAIIALTPAGLSAQVRPTPGSGDPRIQTVLYDADQVVQLQGTPGFQIDVEFASDEAIENVAVGDSAAWQVTPNRRGDHLFVKPLMGGVTTNMTVVTSARTYFFELAPLSGGDQAYTVRFRYPSAQAAADEAQASAIEGRYRLSGAHALRPSRISDDGVHTYIEWPREASLPATYALNNQGQETLVNGGMRDGLFVIDGVSTRLVFRIDSNVARADRISERASR
jgi:type IV secretion system protein VirB9